MHGDSSSKMILILCHGNINRSPACAAVLRKQHPSWTIKSAGFVNPGKPATKKMREAMAERGYDLSTHRSQLVTTELGEWADHIIIMDNANMRRFREICPWPHQIDKVIWLGSVRKLRRIPDPNYMKRGSEEFNAVVELIIECTREIGELL